jgi:TPR repeat protein
MLRKAALEGDAESQFQLGVLLCAGESVHQDEQEGRRLLNLAAKQGHAQARSALEHARQSDTEPVADTEALASLRRSAGRGNPDAQVELGMCFAAGTGVPKDEREAARLYRLAADKGHAEAQLKLGNCFLNGIGVAKDGSEAARLFRLAADQGNSSGLCNLGFCYQNGIGVPVDVREAVRLFRRAVLAGNM